MSKAALIVVDVQNDFLPPDGALAVPNGREILQVIEGLLDERWGWACVIASQDYHPPGHISFASTHPPHEPFSELALADAKGEEYVQTLWPEHCVQGTKGCEIEQSVETKLTAWGDRLKIVRKGTHPLIEAYSAFDGYLVNDVDPQNYIGPKLPADSELARNLRSNGIGKVVIVGLATDFCVGQTSISALSASFDTLLLAPGMRAISSEGEQKILEKVVSLGGKVVGRGESKEWEDELQRWLGT